MIIRSTIKEDLPFLDALFDTCRQYMQKEGNPTQWTNQYPTSKIVAGDITAGVGYVCLSSSTDEVLGSFALSNYEEIYDHLYEGQWSADKPYVVVHRLAALPGKGTGQFIFDWLMKKYPYIRIDTHEDNKTMIHILKKLGFNYCGKIFYPEAGERIAFDYQRQ